MLERLGHGQFARFGQKPDQRTANYCQTTAYQHGPREISRLFVALQKIINKRLNCYKRLE
jgi:hypothetical protein